MSLFLGMYSLNTILAMMLNPSNSIHFFLGVLSAAYTGVVFIKAMQCFPRQLLSKDILKEGKENMLHRYFVLLLGRLNLWGFMAVACLILFILVTYIPLLNPLVNLLILGTAFGYLFLSYRKADKKDRSKILWIFWGLLMFIILFIGVTIYRLFYGTGNPNIHIAVSLLSRLILIFSFLMSVFFADTFDAKLVIQRTAINGVLFLIVVLIYNTLENYIVHFIARALHIQDVLLSSFFAGLFALSISPIHSKLTHIVKSYLKKNSEEEAKSDRE
jgi:hypothetical protein